MVWKKVCIAACVCLILTGCINPFSKFLKQEKEIDKTQQKIEAVHLNRDELSKGYVYGANLALEKETNNSPNINIAKEFTDKSLIITGLPNAQNAADFSQIVEGKLSTNKVENKYADELLRLKNKQIILLEKDVEKLTSKLEKQEEAFKEQAMQNAKDAQLIYNIRKWFRLAMFGFLGFIGIRIASLFIPALAPIGNILDFTVGGLFKIATKTLPKAKEAAGVVAKESYELSEKTLNSLVQAIQQARQNTDVKTVLDPILKDVTDKETTRVKILDKKKELGYI